MSGRASPGALRGTRSARLRVFCPRRGGPAGRLRTAGLWLRCPMRIGRAHRSRHIHPPRPAVGAPIVCLRLPCSMLLPPRRALLVRVRSRPPPRMSLPADVRGSRATSAGPGRHPRSPAWSPGSAAQALSTWRAVSGTGRCACSGSCVCTALARPRGTFSRSAGPFSPASRCADSRGLA